MAPGNAIKEVAMMKKTIAAGAIALTLAGAGFALAQQSSQQTTQPSPTREGRGFQPSAEDVAALTDARVAGLKAGLKLTAEQEKNWPAVETAIRDLAKDRGDRIKERAARREARRGGDTARQAGPDAIARLRQGADAMTARAASLKKLADASEPLYKGLDDGQKRRFAMLLRMGGRPDGAGRHWQRRADNVR
jgi:zinc resistance-associated protein